MTKMNIDELFSYMVFRYLERYGQIPKYLSKLIKKSVLRLLDSKMIIEDNFEPISELAVAKIKQDLPIIHNNNLILEEINVIKQNGFGPSFQKFTGQLGAIMIANCASITQQLEVDKWGKEGKIGAFLMTDRGGPNLTSWISECEDLEEESVQMKIDKVWGISAHKLDFGLISVKKDKMMTPVAFLVPPDSCKLLTKTTIGIPFLDNYVQLGNVKGEIKLSKINILSSGGISGISRFLFLARPRFILAVLSHVQWLYAQKRISMYKEQMVCMDFIINCANHIINEKYFDRHSVDTVLALKLINNEFLLDLVVNEQAKSLLDQRDLLALSKMEGSSYRCMYEIYMKNNRKTN